MGHDEAGGGLRFGVPPENFVPSQSTTPPERNLIARRVAGQIWGVDSIPNDPLLPGYCKGGAVGGGRA